MNGSNGGASLDLRPLAAFNRSHLAQATHVDGLEALSHRFSTLPAPTATEGVRICVVVVARNDWTAAREALERWNFQAWVVGEDEVELEASSESIADEASGQTLAEICQKLPPAEAGPSKEAALAFWRSARQAGLVFSSADGERTAADRPHLLHSPSPLVPRAMSLWQCVEEGKSVARAVDLGCGGGRDLAWLCELGRLSHSPVVWRCTGIDNLEPALRRAALLLSDAGYSPSTSSDTSSNGIDALVWAQTTSQGSLQALLPGIIATRRPAKDKLTPPLTLANFAAAHLSTAQFDLVLLVRFLPRALLPSLRSIVAPGGLIAISHFAAVPPGGEEYESPPPEGRLGQEELPSLVRAWNEGLEEEKWCVLDDRVDRAEDGRPLRSVILGRDR